MTSQTTEKAFEDAILDSLINSGGYQLGKAANFDRELALDRLTLLQFIQNSQHEAWKKLSEIHRGTVEGLSTIFSGCLTINPASARVIEKNGFSESNTFVSDGNVFGSKWQDKS